LKAGRIVPPSRGVELRKHLGLPARSPLTDRAVRSHLEHFEGLDLWAAGERKTQVFGDVGATTQVADLKNRLRTTTRYRDFVYGRGFPRDLSDALDDLARRLEAALNRTAAPDTHPILSEPGNARFARM
jgi:hypothetical protein